MANKRNGYKAFCGSEQLPPSDVSQWLSCIVGNVSTMFWKAANLLYHWSHYRQFTYKYKNRDLLLIPHLLLPFQRPVVWLKAPPDPVGKRVASRMYMCTWNTHGQTQRLICFLLSYHIWGLPAGVLIYAYEKILELSVREKKQAFKSFPLTSFVEAQMFFFIRIV